MVLEPTEMPEVPLSDDDVRAARCCAAHRGAVMWNEFNGVVQCQSCGHIWVPYVYPSEQGQQPSAEGSDAHKN